MPRDKNKTKLETILRDFSQPRKGLSSGIFGGFYKHSVSKSYEKWRLVRFLFDDILRFRIMDQPMEKINWEIPFVYKKKYHCFVAHQKFGFRVYVSNGDTKNPKEIAEEIVEVIDRALNESSPLIKSYANIALSNGEISIDNMLRELKKPYEYFKLQVIARKLKIGNKLGISLYKEMPKNFEKLLEMKEEINYLEQAAYVAFFSLLEHLCVLVLALRDIPERNNVKDFVVGKNWQDKFKTVFDLNYQEFKKSYDYLLAISRYKRNPSVHGLFDKLYLIFYFYLPQARHRISVGLYDQNILLQWRDERLNFDKLDAFLQLLSVHKSTKRIMGYLETGLNVTFSGECEDLQSFTDEEFNQFLEYQVRLSDNLGDMDW